MTPFRTAPSHATCATCPDVDILIAVLNEATVIRTKLENLAQLTYPRDRLRVFVIDGGSTDGTPEIARRWASGSGIPVDVIITARPGKPDQLTVGFAASRARWVLVTDADSRLESATLALMVQAAEADPRVRLVGTPVRPQRTHRIDELHWRVANWFRELEQRLGSAGIAVGPAYLAHRELLAPFPAGTIMDDIHVSCRVALVGGRTAVVPSIVRELRAPLAIAEMLRHKYRKALGYLREMLHFLPQAGRMTGPARTAFCVRFAILAALPLISAAACGAMLTGALTMPAAAVCLGVLLVTAWLAGSSRPAVSLCSAAMLLPVLWAATVTLAWLSYPFVHQTARYPKVSLSADELG
jgi:cellulose synthase/poly-beta-1,6-N-acetylglucosamine synthase-like glycosyltransferase